MPAPPDARELLDREFFEIRAKLLEIGASLDRLDRAAGSLDGDRRMEQLHRAIDLLGDGAENRAERLQRNFSLPYDEAWREHLGVSR